MFFLFPINCGAISFIPFVFIPQKSKEGEKRRRKMGKTIIMSFFARHYRDVTKHQDNEDSALHPEILRVTCSFEMHQARQTSGSGNKYLV